MLTVREIDISDDDAITPHIAPRGPVVDVIERHGYRPPASHRLFGGAGTVVIGGLLVAGFLLALSHVDRPKAVAPPLVVSLLPAATPQHDSQKPTVRAKPVRKPVIQPERREVQPPPLVVPSPVPSQNIPPAVAPQPPAPVAASPPQPAKPVPAEPAQARHGPDSWEGRVLARLERYRRYPSDAQRARQQGTATICFRIDRSGHILSSALARSSGIQALDDAAMETLRRAEPLPKIPADRPDEIELVVPIEFFVK